MEGRNSTTRSATAGSNAGPSNKKRQHPRNNFDAYYGKINKMVNGINGLETDGLTSEAIGSLNAILIASIHSLYNAAKSQALNAKKLTLTPKHFASAVETKVGKRNVEEGLIAGQFAVQKFQEAKDKPTAKKADGKPIRVSTSKKSGLVLPEARVRSIAQSAGRKNGTDNQRASADSFVFLTGVLQKYLQNILEIAYHNAREAGRKRVKGNDIKVAILGNSTLNKIFGDYAAGLEVDPVVLNTAQRKAVAASRAASASRASARKPASPARSASPARMPFANVSNLSNGSRGASRGASRAGSRGSNGGFTLPQVGGL